MSETAFQEITSTADVAKLMRRLERERASRREAEAIAEKGLRELYEREQQLGLIARIASAANQSQSVRDVFQFVLTQICEFMGWPVGHACVVSSCAEVVRLRSMGIWHATNPDSIDEFRRATEEIDFEPGIGLPGRVYTEGTAAWFFDVTQSDNFPRLQVAKKCGLRAACAFPVMLGDEVAAVLEFFTDKAMERDERQLQLMSQVGLQLGRVIERKRAEDRLIHDASRLTELNADLQHGKNLLTLATQAAGIVCWEFKVATRTMLWAENDIESLRAAGVDMHAHPDALIAMIHRGDAAAALAAMHTAIAEGRGVCALRLRILTPTGNTVHVKAHVRLYCDAHGQLDHVLGVAWDVTDQVRQEERQLKLQAQLRDVSHQAGMAEVATGVLHNIGNVLNSLGVSAALMLAGLRDSRAGNVQRLAKLLTEQEDRLEAFLRNDPRGREIPRYLAQLGEHLVAEKHTQHTEMQAIVTHVEHIGKIVAAQQSYAHRGGISEEVDVAELIDNAIVLNFAGETDVTVNRDYQVTPQLTLDRHKVMQILANLLSNARHALSDQTQGMRFLTVRIRPLTEGALSIEVEDSGIGIEFGVLQRLFEFGFTTKKDGHGFGLHASANLAKELGGELSGLSDGPGRGARFSLRLPVATTDELAVRKRA